MRVRIWSCPRVVNAQPAARFRLLALGFLVTLASSLAASPRWSIQFLYDKADSNLAFNDMECPTPQQCIAAGLIDDKKGHDQGAVVVSSDAGAHWTQYEVKERPVSLYFLNDSVGWMVTDRGLWSTVEGGRAWTKVTSRKGIVQAWFLDANHGYIAGMKGLVEETTDGGKTWAKLETSTPVPDPTSVNYDIISFQGSHGVITGAHDVAVPSLTDPKQKSQASGKITLLETLDGGKKWSYGTIGVDGELAQLRLSRTFVLTLLLYSDSKLQLSSAVFKTQLGAREGSVIFARRDRAAADVALLSDGSGIIAAVEPPGNSPQVLIPGKLKILKSADLKDWQEMDVDYRAVAQRAVIAAPDAEHMWVATDTGAILKMIK